MCITFDRNQKWGCSKQHLLTHKESVDFSVCKSDRNVLLNPNHPDLYLTVPPQTSRANKEVQRRRRSRNEKSTEPPQKIN